MGHDVTALKAAERGVGYLPQDLALFPTMTVREHLEFALDVRRWDRRAVARRVEELAGAARPGAPARPPAGGAQRRRVTARGAGAGAVVRAARAAAGRAAQRPGRRDAAGDVRAAAPVQRQTGVTALHVTHNLGEAKALADRLFVLKAGAIHEAGPEG